MTDYTGDPQHADVTRLALAMGLGSTDSRVWKPGELAAVFRHQMAAPISVDLGSLGPRVVASSTLPAEGGDLLLKSFRDLFLHRSPPVELLVMVKEYAKLNRDQPDSVIPSEVASVLYFLTIGAALVRCQSRITKLNDEQIRAGFSWVLQLDWIDEATRDVVLAAVDTLSGEPNGESHISQTSDDDR